MATLPGLRWRWALGAIVVAVVLAVVVVRSGDDAPDPGTGETPVAESVVLDRLRPMPQDAKDDRPAIYDEGSGCQVTNGNRVPEICVSGDESADRLLMLVGDSKIAQWETAYSDLGRAGGWRVETMTKSACPFTDAAITADRKVKTDCREWGRSALRKVIAAKPDVVVVSQRASTALLEGKDERTGGAMVRGLHRYWQQLIDAGIQVVVHLDNPFPTTHPVYQCVEDHPDDVSRCAFDFDEGLAESAAPVLREAAESLPGVRIVDMGSAICPGGVRCPAVIGDILLYRAGSHLTRTFVVSVEQQLGRELAAATDGVFG